MENEYICVNQHELTSQIKVLLRSENKSIDVSTAHLLLGYNPLIIAISKQELNSPDGTYTLQFYTNELLCGIIKLQILPMVHDSLCFFEGIKAKHSLLNPLQKLMHGLKQIRAAKSHPLYPDKNRYDQIRVPYSFPRNISVLTLRKGELYNIFPTDLYGEIFRGKEYIISLRENGKAYEQVKNADEITLSKVASHAFERIYLLGKNHMQDMKALAEFQNHLRESKPDSKRSISKDCIQYRVLRNKHEIKLGIHCLITFSIDEKIDLHLQNDSLSHIHEYYALWRKRHKYKDNLLIRS